VQQTTLKLNFSLLLCLLVQISFAQEEKKPDTVKVPAPKIKFYPRSVRVGTDLISLIKSQTDKSFSGWEINGDVDCGKYYPAVDYGHWARSYTLPNGGDYQNSGNYWRVGIDANLLLKDPDRNMFFFGLRYAHSSFSESATIVTVDPYFGETRTHLNNSAVTASWGELITGLRVKIFSNFWLGYTARMKFGPNVKGATQMTTYDIPGYGLYEEGIYWGFNYQAFWSIPIKKEKKPRVAAQ
jgi:hypothetical protein